MSPLSSNLVFLTSMLEEVDFHLFLIDFIILLGGGSLAVEYQSKDCQLVLKDSAILFNNALFGGALNVENHDSYLIIKNCVFDSNQGFSAKEGVGGGSVFTIRGRSKTFVVTENCIFMNHKRTARGIKNQNKLKKKNILLGGVFIANGGNFYDTNTTFVMNNQAYGGGVGFLNIFSEGHFKDSKFYLNGAIMKGGVIGLSANCYVYFENVVVLGSSCKQGGVFSFMDNSYGLIINSTFIDNYAENGALIAALENYGTNVSFKNSTFETNFADVNLFSVSNAYLNLESLLFKSNKQTLFYGLDANYYLKNISVINQLCTSKDIGCVANFDGSLVYGEYLNIKGTLNEKENGNIFMTSSTAYLNEVLIENITTLGNVGGSFYMLESLMQLNNSKVTGIILNSIFAQKSSIIFDSSNFLAEESSSYSQKKYSFQYGLIFFENSFSINFINSSFIGGKGKNGGAAAFVNDLSFENISEILFEQCNFHSNSVSENGGALYLVNLKGKADNCVFKNNKGNNGGGIYFNSFG